SAAEASSSRVGLVTNMVSYLAISVHLLLDIRPLCARGKDPRACTPGGSCLCGTAIYYSKQRRDCQELPARFDALFCPFPRQLPQQNPRRRAAGACGGKKGIRTLEGFRGPTRFPVVRLRPAQPSFHIRSRPAGRSTAYDIITGCLRSVKHFFGEK